MFVKKFPFLLFQVQFLQLFIQYQNKQKQMKFITAGIIGLLYATVTKSDVVVNVVENCVVYAENGQCSQCQNRFINTNGICVKVNDLCETWDQTSGECLTCYGGYSLQQGNCVINDEILIVISPNIETKCPPRSILKNGNCQAVSDLCNTWDQETGECLTCYGGYVLKQGSCITEQSQQNDGQASSDCPFRTVKKGDKCEAVSDQCNTWDNQTADCLTCYGGYVLKEGACVAESSTPNQQNHQQASENCAFRTVKKNGKCEAVNDLCNTWDQVSGQCLTCYGGYALKEGACVVSKNLTFEPSNCPFRAVKVNGECKQVSDLCNTWDDSTGDCLTCYGGYNLAEGKCVL